MQRRSLECSLLKTAAASAAFEPLLSEAQEKGRIDHLKNIPLGPNVKLTMERRGQIVLFGINRPNIQNRIDPETSESLGRAYYDYEHDPTLRVAILFGHGPISRAESTSMPSPRGSAKATHPRP